jgi:mannan endo-1,6-alpha-mannosidase
MEGIILQYAKITTDSIKSAASAVASNVVSYYHGNETGQTVGILGSPYEWWEAGTMFDALIQYWQLTGDDQYNGIVAKGILAQEGQNDDFMPANQTSSEGNDDQGIWALAAMSAAESKLPDSSSTTWVELAEAVFNEYVSRWDTSTCNGGLRWQIQPYDNGYTDKNSVSNGAFFQLASRLARYTGNSTYSDWASKVFDWTTSIGLIDGDWNVFDGADTTANCTDIDHYQFSYVAGMFVSGAAHMYNTTSGSAQWEKPLSGLLNRTLSVFFINGIATETACENKQNNGTCTSDMQSYKGMLGRWLVDTMEMAPFTSASIMPMFTSTAAAAAKSCTQGASGNGCQFYWNSANGNDSAVGLGADLDALSYVQGLLANQVAAPATGTAGSTGSTTSGSASPTSSHNAGVAVRGGHTSMSFFAGMFGSIAWLIL